MEVKVMKLRLTMGIWTVAMLLCGFFLLYGFSNGFQFDFRGTPENPRRPTDRLLFGIVMFLFTFYSAVFATARSLSRKVRAKRREAGKPCERVPSILENIATE